MKQKIKFRMRWRTAIGIDSETVFAISPEREICPGLGCWQKASGMTWYPVVGEKAQA